MNMGFLLGRKLSLDPPNGTSSIADICLQSCDPSVEEYCQDDCIPFCVQVCPDRLPPPPPPPPPPITLEHHPAQPNKLLIASITVLATAFFLACCYAMYVKFYVGPRRRRRRRQEEEGGEEQRNQTQDVFLDEDHGPVVDHPIWYINTVGLQPSVISSITVCKYKRGEGLVEGTECSVCLSEFQEDETLRLLPKCSHAFHIPCIDTWLRAHTNCPMCRAPIVTSTARSTPSSEDNIGSSSTGDGTRVAVEEIERESDREVESGDTGLRAVTREEGSELDGGNGGNSCEEDFAEVENGFQPLRRSISLDSLSAFKISQALANVTPREPDRNSRTALGTEDESNKEVASNGAGSSSRGLLNLMASSSIGRSLQIGPSSLVRSFSCSGKLLMSRYNQNRS